MSINVHKYFTTEGEESGVGGDGSESGGGGGEEGWLSGWGLAAGLQQVVQKTSTVVQQTVQHTTSVVSNKNLFSCSLIYRKCSSC